MFLARLFLACAAAFAGVAAASPPGTGADPAGTPPAAPQPAPAKAKASALPYYSTLDFENLPLQEGLCHLPVTGWQQSTDYTCGPASVLSLLRYWGLVTETDPKILTKIERQLAAEMGSNMTCGTTPEAILAWFQAHGIAAALFEQDAEHNDTVTPYWAWFALKDRLRAGAPVLVEWSDWGGHWVVAKGFDDRGTADFADDVIFFADPYDRHDDRMEGTTIFNMERFYWMWYDARLFGRYRARIHIVPGF
ncbi:MAG: C39 family peptidase [Acidobacteria bacterium]|nr:C39 family peptidase [Acidobacteriota bacterium]